MNKGYFFGGGRENPSRWWKVKWIEDKWQHHEGEFCPLYSFLLGLILFQVNFPGPWSFQLQKWSRSLCPTLLSFNPMKGDWALGVSLFHPNKRNFVQKRRFLTPQPAKLTPLFQFPWASPSSLGNYFFSSARQKSSWEAHQCSLPWAKWLLQCQAWSSFISPWVNEILSIGLSAMFLQREVNCL